MTNTGTVSQPPIAAGKAIGDRPRETGGRANGSEDGAFPQVLGALAAAQGDRAGQETAPTEEGRPPDTYRRKLAGWLEGNAEVLQEGAQEEVLEMVAGGLAVGLTNADAGLLQSAPADPAGSPALGINGTGAVLAIGGILAIATGANDGNAVEPGGASTASGNTGMPSADLMLAGVASEPLDSSEQPAAAGPREAAATVTVLQRETHLAPARAGAAVSVASGLASLATGSADRGSRAGPRPSVHAADATTSAPSGNGPQRGAGAQPAVPHVAVTAAQGAEPDVPLPRGDAFIAGRQGGGDAPPNGDAAGIEQSAAVTRADVLVPGGPASGPVQQIALRVVAEASAAQQTARPDAPAFAPGTASGSAVKVLYVQLQPADLGTVTIRLSLKEQALRLDVEVGRGETAQLIQRDRDALSTLLRAAGYLIDGLDVRVADHNPPSTTAGSQPSMQMPGDGQSGSSQADPRSHGARSQEQRQGNAFGNERNGEDEQARRSPGGRDIYL